MTASELRELEKRLTNIVPADLEAAAEVLELVAWAEDSKAVVENGTRWWFVKLKGFRHSGSTLIATLRRAKEAAR